LRESGAGLVYADAVGHPRIDYQRGSIRDNFDFGPLVALSVPVCRAVEREVQPRDWRWGGLYDLRLRLSERYAIVHIAEPLYAATAVDTRPTEQKQFDYVDPKNREYQIGMEQIATEHLKRIGAFIEASFRKPARPADPGSGVLASVVIPVRNR